LGCVHQISICYPSFSSTKKIESSDKIIFILRGYMIKKTTSWTVFVYGIVLIGLGILGYWQGSLVSLLAGAGFGVLLIISSRIMFSHKKWGLYVAAICSAILTVTFSIRHSISQKPLPAILAVLSGGMLLFLIAQIAKWKKSN
jgi:uncharacterized membrane protein (UPF0136 family)